MGQILLGSFPSYAANSTKQIPIGGLPPAHEVHALQIAIEGTIASSTTAFNGDVSDINKILAALISKVRFTYNGVADAVNLTPAELRSIALIFLGRDGTPQNYPNVSAAVQVPASGSPATVKLQMFLPFVHRGLENPALVAPSSDQFNVPGTHLDYDAGAGGAAITLTNGTGVFVVSDIKVYASVLRSLAPFCSPTILMRTKTIAQSIDTEQGSGLDLFLADERLPATLEGQVQQLTVVRDGIPDPRNSTPRNLAALYAMTQVPQDAGYSYDITAQTAIGTQAGAQLSPIVWVPAHVRADERELPAWIDHRQIQQNLAAGGSANATYLFVQVKSIDQATSFIQTLARQFNVPLAPAQLPVKGGGGSDNSVSAPFKPRWIAKR